MEIEIGMENIMSGDEMDSLFTVDPTQQEDEVPALEKQDPDENISTAEGEIDPEEIFTPESVGGEEVQDKNGEKPDSQQEDGSSPESNDFYSSIATACKEEGIFPDLDDESLKEIKDAEGFKKAMNKQVQAMLDEKQRRISEALDYGVEPDEVQRYERVIDYLDGISEESIKDEGDKGIALRRQLIFNDYLNRGFSKERAQRYTQRAFDQGTDIEDAIEAKNSNKEYFSTQYSKLVEEAKEQAEEEAREEKRKAESIRNSILETEEPFEGIKLDKATRQRVFDLISKPVYKDKDGSMYTALQKAQRDDEEGFIKKLGYMYVLTDGFKNLDGLVKGKVQKETKRGFQRIEKALRTPAMGGEPKFASGVDGGDEIKAPGLILDV